MEIESCFLDPLQPPRTATTTHFRVVDLQVFLDHSGNQLPQLRVRQRRSPDFSPAAFPDSRTTRPTSTTPDDDATQSNSAPDSRPNSPQTESSTFKLR